MATIIEINDAASLMIMFGAVRL